MKTSSLTWRWKALSHKQILLGRTTHAVSHARRCASEASGAPQRPDRRKSALSIKQTPSSTPGAATPRARQAASLRPHVRLANGAAVVVILFTRCYHRVVYTVLPSGAARATASDPTVVATPEGKQQPCSIEA